VCLTNPHFISVVGGCDTHALDSIEYLSIGDNQWTLLKPWRLPRPLYSFECQLIDNEYIMITAGTDGCRPGRPSSTEMAEKYRNREFWRHCRVCLFPLYSLHEIINNNNTNHEYGWIDGPPLPSPRLTVGSIIL
jgi:hypothetical protein